MISNLTWQLFKSALKQYQGAIIGGLIAVLCGGAIGWFVHERITQSEIHGLNVELRQKEKAISGYEQERREAAERHVATLQAAERHVATLQAALTKFNTEQQHTQDLEKKLHDTQLKLTQTQQKLEERIDEAVKRDGHPNCFGDNGLQLYTEALGY